MGEYSKIFEGIIMKRILSIFIVVIMAVSIFCIYATSVAADSTEKSTTYPTTTEIPTTKGVEIVWDGWDIVLPHKTVYIEGEILDLTGFEYYYAAGIVYTDGTSEFTFRGRVPDSELTVFLEGKPLTLNDTRVGFVPSYQHPTICVVIGGSFDIIVLPAGQPNILINGNPVMFSDQRPIIKNSRVLVPVRDVFEYMDFAVDWDSDMRQAILHNDEFTVVITENSNTFTANEKFYNFDVPVQIINGRMMVPIRAVLESVGCTVDWDGERNIVIVTLADDLKISD